MSASHNAVFVASSKPCNWSTSFSSSGWGFNLKKAYIANYLIIIKKKKEKKEKKQVLTKYKNR